MCRIWYNDTCAYVGPFFSKKNPEILVAFLFIGIWKSNWCSLRGYLFDAHDECLFEAAKNSKPQHQFGEIVARNNTGYGACFLCDLNSN